MVSWEVNIIKSFLNTIEKKLSSFPQAITGLKTFSKEDENEYLIIIVLNKIAYIKLSTCNIWCTIL